MWQGAGRLVADRYALEAVLHGRGLGVVCRARDLADDRPVALKQLRPPEWLPATELPSLAARIRREVAVAATVEHPALAAVYDLVDDGGQPVLVMELVDGVTLHELVRRHGPLPPRRSAQLAAEVLAGLAAMHQAGVLHGAVSPGTLLVTPAGAAKLVGVGSSVLRLHPRALAGSSRSRVVAPELAAGEPHGAAVDVWATGATLHYAAVGRPPSGAAGAAPELAGWLGSVVARLLAADPAGRPSAGDAARLLVETAPASVPLRLPRSNSPPWSPPGHPSRRPRRPCRPRPRRHRRPMAPPGSPPPPASARPHRTWRRRGSSSSPGPPKATRKRPARRPRPSSSRGPAWRTLAVAARGPRGFRTRRGRAGRGRTRRQARRAGRATTTTGRVTRSPSG